MADGAIEVPTSGLVDTSRSEGLAKRRSWPDRLKRQIVAETDEPGASVSVVARRHDVNANQVFKWRCELLPSEQREEDSGLLHAGPDSSFAWRSFRGSRHNSSISKRAVTISAWAPPKGLIDMVALRDKIPTFKAI